MTDEEHSLEDFPVPALLRFARGSYSQGIRRRLAEVGLDDLPRNGPYVLGGMANQGGTLDDLVEDLGITKQAASQLLETLVVRGFLERHEVAGDRRRVSIQLTNRGRSAAQAVRQGVIDVDQLLAASISPEQLQGMRKGLAALAAIRHQLQHEPSAPTAAPAPGDTADVPLVVAQATRRAFERQGVDRLGQHLAQHYGVKVGQPSQLDVAVFQVPVDGGPAWVARVMPAGRPLAWAQGDAEILGLLEAEGYPAERPAAGRPVSVLDDQAVLVTRYVEPVPRQGRRDAVRQAGGFTHIGELLGRLHSLPVGPGAAGREGGGWHHLVDGGPQAEVSAAIDLLVGAQEAARSSGAGPADDMLFGQLADQLGQVDVGVGLPEALCHPDFVLANMVAAKDNGLVPVDWTGAGRCPRLWPLAFLLWSAGAQDLGRVDRVVAGYRRHVRLSPEELERLPAMVKGRPLVLRAWELALGRRSGAEVAAAVTEADELARAVAERALAAFAA